MKEWSSDGGREDLTLFEERQIGGPWGLKTEDYRMYT